MGGCQNYGPLLGTLNIRCRIIVGTQKGTIILTTTHMGSNYRFYILDIFTYGSVGSQVRNLRKIWLFPKFRVLFWGVAIKIIVFWG